jgi:DNA-binding CsgD family transcriptional regulator/general stress protein CsbA
LLSAFIIQRIYKKELHNEQINTKVNGIKWFGWAIFIWGIGSLVQLFGVKVIGLETTNKVLIYSGVTVSLLNSMFILLSLPSIEHNKTRPMIVRLVQRFTEKEFIALFSGLMVIIAFVFIAASYSNEAISNNFIWLIDIPISILVAFSLLNELNKAFSNRQMKFMYLPSFALFLLIVIAVSHRIIPQDRVVTFIDQEFWTLTGMITALSFKFIYILLFSILLYSWKFLTERELKQSQLELTNSENLKLATEVEKLLLANESHLDTIRSLNTKVETLKESSKVELSQRQKEVLSYLAKFGETHSYNQIAEEMNISVDGLQTHIHQIKKLLNISGSYGKEQLIAFAKKEL